MELKRILARDARTANEKAVAQYGPDVLIISSNQVNGLTELIVATDIPDLTPDEVEPQLQAAPQSSKNGKFDALLSQAIDNNKKAALQRQATKETKPLIEVTAKAERIAPATRTDKAERAHAMAPSAKMSVPAAKDSAREAQAHDMLRGQEIVALVREELASLRKEFKLSQQMAAWQGNMPLPPMLTPLRDALNEAPIPVALRALLIDSIKDYPSLPEAMGALHRQLAHTIDQTPIAAPLSGVHAIAGPSGAGKTMMVARLAQAAALQHGCEKVMVISFRDQRAGAWNQIQLLHAQAGVDCYRATNVSTLQLLLEEHEGRKLILIDTPGVQMQECLTEIRSLQRAIHCHAVVPADASAASLRRVFEAPEMSWASLMLSKLDESSQPWAMLQFLSDRAVPVSVASRGDGHADLVQDFHLDELVQRALDNLAITSQDRAMEWLQPQSGLMGVHRVTSLQQVHEQEQQHA